MLRRNRARRNTEHYLTVSLCALLLLAVCVAVVAYQISPLRDPSFVDQIKEQGWSEAGATVGWLRPERYWWIFVNSFTILFATNVTALASIKIPVLKLIGPKARRNPFRAFPKLLALFGLWILIAYATWLHALGYLLYQLIMD